MSENGNGLKQQLIQAIDVVEFIRSNTHHDWTGEEQHKLPCPLAETRHEQGDDSTASLSVNPNTGAFNCFGCGWKGTSILGYATDVLFDGNFKQALAVLFSKYVRKTIGIEEIAEHHKNLIKKPRLLHSIAATRGWNETTIRKLKIGWLSDEKRTVIPIFNLQGYCLDIRLHDTLYRAALVEGKRLSSKGNRNSRTGDWFP